MNLSVISVSYLWEFFVNLKNIPSCVAVCRDNYSERISARLRLFFVIRRGHHRNIPRVLVGFQLFRLDPDEDTKVWYHTASSTQKRKLNSCQNQRTSSLFCFFASCVVLEPFFCLPHLPPKVPGRASRVPCPWFQLSLMEWLLLLCST